MSQPNPMDSQNSAHRAAAAAAQAARLRGAARTLRRLAGAIKYQPAAGTSPRPTAALADALTALEHVLNEIQQSAGARAEEEAALAALASLSDPIARQIRLGHAAVEQGAQITAAAVDVLRGVFGASDAATLDAPYGHGAPGRHHPGALCTIVAERAESLAGALEAVTIAKANRSAGAR